MERRTPSAASGRRPGRLRGRPSPTVTFTDEVRPAAVAPTEPPCPAEVEARLSVLLRWP